MPVLEKSSFNLPEISLMKFNVELTESFKKDFKVLRKKYVSLKADLDKLIDLLEINPETGIPLGRNCYKIRLAIASKNKGKSGGARVITYVVISETTVYLLSIFDKSEKESIADEKITKLLEDLE